ncbi:unnamed protein product [Rhizopus stolonifer]
MPSGEQTTEGSLRASDNASSHYTRAQQIILIEFSLNIVDWNELARKYNQQTGSHETKNALKEEWESLEDMFVGKYRQYKRIGLGDNMTNEMYNKMLDIFREDSIMRPETTYCSIRGFKTRNNESGYTTTVVPHSLSRLERFDESSSSRVESTERGRAAFNDYINRSN